jgi:hypothetical protein
MPSTYSPNLRIELIASGEQANTWGLTTNNNLGALIEQAISGETSIVMADANVTLTALDGAVDQSRSMILNITGTNTAIRNIIAPAVNKLYVVANNTGGGFAIGIQTASGTTTLIPSGGSAVLWCDGTNFNYSVTAAPQIQLAADPTLADQAATKHYVDALLPSGTTLLFYQSAAPTGWTQVTSLNDYALRLVSGTGGSTGGSVAFSSAFVSQAVTGSISINTISATSGSTTLTTAQIPSHTHNWGGTGSGTTANGTANIQDPGHTHSVNGYINTDAGGAGDSYGTTHNQGGYINAATTGVYDSGHTHTFSVSISGTTDNGTGGNGGHTHSINLNPTGTFSGNNINLAVQYANVIICSKN